jgi:hypothetical protein
VTSRVGNDNFVGALQALGLDELTDRRLIVVEEAVKIAQRNPAACNAAIFFGERD